MVPCFREKRCLQGKIRTPNQPAHIRCLPASRERLKAQVPRVSTLQIQDCSGRMGEQIEFDTTIERDRQLLAVDATLNNTVHIQRLSQRDQCLRLRLRAKRVVNTDILWFTGRCDHQSRPARGRRSDFIDNTQAAEHCPPGMGTNQS